MEEEVYQEEFYLQRVVGEAEGPPYLLELLL
jgi:hypothetical protein